tara:strand:+ start:56 stop:385 length:330 start_codon:yes stop_codon:yes gene_type:complete
MKKYFYTFILFCGFLFASSTENIDVIKQYDGTIYKGKIIEQNIKDGEGWVKIEIAGGSVIHITKDKIESIESEEIIIEERKTAFLNGWKPDFWFYITVIVLISELPSLI